MVLQNKNHVNNIIHSALKVKNAMNLCDITLVWLYIYIYMFTAAI